MKNFSYKTGLSIVQHALENRFVSSNNLAKFENKIGEIDGTVSR
jgi:hypothetical protein